jgi:hypothetical protein
MADALGDLLKVVGVGIAEAVRCASAGLANCVVEDPVDAVFAAASVRAEGKGRQSKLNLEGHKSVSS